MKLYEIVFLFIITIAHSYTLNKKPFLSNDMTNPNENVEISTKANFITLDIYNRVFPKEIGINQFIFEHPFFITHIVIQFGTIPYKYKILYSYDSISYKEVTKEIELCDIAYSNINSIEFKKPFYAKEIRILSEDVFDIEKIYFYTYKDNVVMITSRINDNDICWYINSNSYNINTEIEGIDCIRAISIHNNNELFLYNNITQSIQHYNSRKCVIEKNTKLFLSDCETNSHITYTNGIISIDNYCDVYYDKEPYMNNLIDEVYSEIIATSEDRNYRKEKLIVKGDSYWTSKEVNDTTEEIIIYFDKTNPTEEKLIDKIVIIWKQEPSDFEVYLYDSDFIYWKLIKVYTNNRDSTNVIEINKRITSNGIKIRMIKTNYKAFALQYIYVGYNSYKLHCSNSNMIQKKLKSFNMRQQKLCNITKFSQIQFYKNITEAKTILKEIKENFNNKRKNNEEGYYKMIFQLKRINKVNKKIKRLKEENNRRIVHSSFLELEDNPIDSMIKTIQSNIDTKGNKTEQYNKAMDIIKDSIKLSEESTKNITSKIDTLVKTVGYENEINILKQENEMLKRKLERKNKKKTPLRQSNVNRTNIVKHIIQNKTKEITNEKQIDKPLQYYIDILKSYYNDTSELEESKIILKDLNGSVDIIEHNINSIKQYYNDIISRIKQYKDNKEQLTKTIVELKGNFTYELKQEERKTNMIMNQRNKLSKNKDITLKADEIKDYFHISHQNSKISSLLAHSYKDIIIKISFYLSNKTNKGVLFRYKNEFNYYGLMFYHNKTISFIKVINGIETSLSSFLYVNTLNSFSITVKGNTFILSNAQGKNLLIANEKENIITKGTIGLYNIVDDIYSLQIKSIVKNTNKNITVINKGNSNYFSESFLSSSVYLNYNINNDNEHYQMIKKKGIHSNNHNDKYSILFVKDRNISQGNISISYTITKIKEDSSINIVFFYKSLIDYYYLSISYQTDILFLLYHKSIIKDELLTQKSYRKDSNKLYQSTHITISIIEHYINVYYNKELLLSYEIQPSSLYGLVGINTLKTECLFTQIDIISSSYSLSFTKEDIAHFNNSYTNNRIILPDIQSISKSFSLLSLNSSLLIYDKINLFHSVTGNIYTSSLKTNKSPPLSIKASYNYSKLFSQCMLYPTEVSQNEYCSMNIKNEIEKEKCKFNFCSFCCEGLSIKPRYTHQCIKQCNHNSHNIEISLSQSKISSLCINPTNSLYKSCSFLSNEINCKYDMCNLCCSSLDRITKSKISIETILKCTNECKTVYNN